MCLLFVLFTNTIIFSLFTISPCALSVNSNNNDKNKDSSIISSKVSMEGSGSVPVNEILSDDEDFFSSSSSIDFSGDGSLDTVHNNKNNANSNGHTIITDPGNHIITTNTDAHNNHGDDETKNEEGDGEGDGDDDDDDDDEDDLDESEDDSEADHHENGEGGNHHNPIENGDNHAAESDNNQSLDHHRNEIGNDTSILEHVNNYDLKQDTRPVSILVQPSMLAAVIGGIVVSLLCAILLAMFIIYRTRKKDEGSYICEPSLTSPVISHYGKASSNKFYDP